MNVATAETVAAPIERGRELASQIELQRAKDARQMALDRSRCDEEFPKTEASMRAVPLQARALDVLHRIMNGNGSALVFRGERGGYVPRGQFKPDATVSCDPRANVVRTSERPRECPA